MVGGTLNRPFYLWVCSEINHPAIKWQRHFWNPPYIYCLSYQKNISIYLCIIFTYIYIHIIYFYLHIQIDIYIYTYMLVSPWILVDDFLNIHPLGTGSLVRGGFKH